MLPTVAQLMLQNPQAFVGRGKAVLLTDASGTWTKRRGSKTALIVATGPGGPGVAGSRSGAAGGTAIILLDIYKVASLAYTVGQQNTTDDTTIAGMTAANGVNAAPGNASGGLVNLPGGMGLSVPVTGITVSPGDVVLSGVPLYTEDGIAVVLNPSGTGTPGSNVQAGTYATTASGSVTKGPVPGAPSFWGGCDSDAPNHATVYGAGGPANATQLGYGGPGCIAIWEW